MASTNLSYHPLFPYRFFPKENGTPVIIMVIILSSPFGNYLELSIGILFICAVPLPENPITAIVSSIKNFVTRNM